MSIEDLESSDAGNITCIAKNIAGVSTHVVHVHVSAQLSQVQRVAITVGIVIPVLVILIVVILGVCLYSYYRRGTLVPWIQKRRSSSIGDDSGRFSLQNIHGKPLSPFANDPMSISTNPRDRDSLRADSLTHLEFAGLTSPIETQKHLNGDIHQAFVNGMRQSLDRKSKNSRSRI